MAPGAARGAKPSSAGQNGGVESALDIARGLQARDAELAAAIAELRALEREADALRARAAELDAFLSCYPAQRADLDRRRVEALGELAQRRAEEREALEALERARERRGEAEVEEAERAVARTRRALIAAEQLVARIERIAEDVERRRADAERAAPEVESAAREAAARLHGLARVAAPAPPEAGLSGVADWGGRARAALFVARSGLEREHELVVREANEMGAALLGDPLFAGGTAGLRRRLEAT